MKIMEVNSVVYGSTGAIMRGIGEAIISSGDEVLYSFPKGRHVTNREIPTPYISIGSRLSQDIHLILGRLLGVNGLLSIFATIRFLLKIYKIQPDIIHIHNIHKDYINLYLFFKYIRIKQVKLVWTLHDCWSFTGRCPHYQVVRCDRWLNGCTNCKYPKNEYPQSFINTSCFMWKFKKKLYGDLKNLWIVTPSVWLANEVKKSFLYKNEVIVINNGIDLDIFNYTPGRYDLKLKKEIKFLVLGVSMDWNYKKGLDIFIELSQRLPFEYQIVLVGIEEKAKELLPFNIITIKRTDTAKELAAIYSMADVFVNPTREDTFPTVNIESLACGTPVITRNVGGSPEIIDSKTGLAVDGTIESFETAIRIICTQKPFSRENCRSRALKFDKQDKFKDYINLFHSL